jgi:hypothetical protein
MKFHLLVPVVLAYALAGCVGTLTPVNGEPGGDDVGGPDGGGGGGAAETQFNSSVAPLLNAACASCHAGTAATPPKFLGAVGTPGYYDSITVSLGAVGNFTPTCGLLIKGEHDGGNARAWLQTEKDTITAWINAEAAERGL